MERRSHTFFVHQEYRKCQSLVFLWQIRVLASGDVDFSLSFEDVVFGVWREHPGSLGLGKLGGGVKVYEGLSL